MNFQVEKREAGAGWNIRRVRTYVPKSSIKPLGRKNGTMMKRIHAINFRCQAPWCILSRGSERSFTPIRAKLNPAKNTWIHRTHNKV